MKQCQRKSQGVRRPAILTTTSSREQEQPDDPSPPDEKERAAAVADSIIELEKPESEAEKTEKDVPTIALLGGGQGHGS